MFNTNNSSNMLQKNETADVDTSVIKISIISGLGVFAAIASSYFMSLLYKEPGANHFTMAAAAIFVFIIIFFLQSIFIKSMGFNMFVAAGETVGLALFLLISNYSFILLVAIALTYLALYISIKKSQLELRNQLIINVRRVAKFTVPKIVTAVVILLSVIYSQPFFPENVSVSKNLVKSVLSPSETIVKIVADKYLGLKLDNFSIDTPISKISISKEGINIPAVLLQQQLQGMGLVIGSNESIVDAFYNLINGKMQKLNDNTRWAIFGSMFLLIFLTIKSFFWLFYWLIRIFIYLIFEILIALGFTKLSYEQISKEILVL